MVSREVKLVRKGMLELDDLTLGHELSLSLPPNAWHVGLAVVYVGGNDNGYTQTRCITVTSYEEVATVFRRAVKFCKDNTSMHDKEIYIDWRSHEYFSAYEDFYRKSVVYDGEEL